MRQYTKSFRNCAVCDFWAGRRETDALGNWVEVDSPNVTGRCQNQKGPYRRQQKMAHMTCTHFKVWVALR